MNLNTTKFNDDHPRWWIAGGESVFNVFLRVHVLSHTMFVGLVAAKTVALATSLPRVGQNAAGGCAGAGARGVVGRRTVGSTKPVILDTARGRHETRHEARRGQQVGSAAKLGPETGQKIVEVGSDEATELQHKHARPRDNQRDEHHGVGHELGGDRDEEEVGLDAALVLGAGVGEGQDKALEVIARVDADEPIKELRSC